MSQSVSGALPRYGNGVPVALGNPRGALKYIFTWERPKNLGFGKVVVISGVTHIKSINMKPSVIINLTNDVPFESNLNSNLALPAIFESVSSYALGLAEGLKMN